MLTLPVLSVQVCPADGRVLHLGRVDRKGRLEQIKGVSYQLEHFLGGQSGLDQRRSGAEAVTGIESGGHSAGLGSNQPPPHTVGEDSALFHICIYLAPGDYHGFHSPANWSAHTRRHFPGTYIHTHIHVYIHMYTHMYSIYTYCGSFPPDAPWYTFL